MYHHRSVCIHQFCIFILANQSHIASMYVVSLCSYNNTLVCFWKNDRTIRHISKCCKCHLIDVQHVLINMILSCKKRQDGISMLLPHKKIPIDLYCERWISCIQNVIRLFKVSSSSSLIRCEPILTDISLVRNSMNVRLLVVATSNEVTVINCITLHCNNIIIVMSVMCQL